MNKLANTYLDAVDSLLAIHLEHVQEPILDDWTMIVSNLAAAVREMNQDTTPDQSVFRHDFTTEELAKREILFSKTKPLKLKDLMWQVDEEYWAGRLSVPKPALSDQMPVWLIGDFEIRRRK